MEQLGLSQAIYGRGVFYYRKQEVNNMAESRKGPQGFIVVLPGEIIEIAQDDDISWLTLF